MSKVKRKAFIIIAVLAIVMFVVYWGNTALEVNQYTVRSCKVPESFEGFCIAQISDLHNAQMGKNNEKLLQVLQKAEPDMIVLTGDVVDSIRTDIEVNLKQ